MRIKKGYLHCIYSVIRVIGIVLCFSWLHPREQLQFTNKNPSSSHRQLMQQCGCIFFSRSNHCMLLESVGSLQWRACPRRVLDILVRTLQDGQLCDGRNSSRIRRKNQMLQARRRRLLAGCWFSWHPANPYSLAVQKWWAGKEHYWYVAQVCLCYCHWGIVIYLGPFKKFPWINKTDKNIF